MVDWIVNRLFGAEKGPVLAWQAHRHNSDDAPIMKLCEAILLQATSDEASGVRLEINHIRAETHAPPTLEQYEWELERMAYRRELERQELKSLRVAQGPKRLLVDFQFSGEFRECMEIPLNLADPTLRALKFKFNFESCASLEKPKGLIYRKGYYLTMKEWNPSSTFISMEPDRDEV